MASVINIYARAFADVVVSRRLDSAATLAQAQQIAGLAEQSRELHEVWDNPAIPTEQKRAVLDAIVKRGGISEPVRNFVAVLIDNGRTRLVGEIVKQFARELNQRLGFADAEVISARPLNADERSSLEQNLARVTGKKIRATYEQDSSLFGGAMVRVGSTVYDGSVKGQLQRIKQALAAGS